MSKFYENTLEVDYVKKLNHCLKNIDEILEDTYHDNRDTQILFDIRKELAFVVNMNTKEQ